MVNSVGGRSLGRRLQMVSVCRLTDAPFNLPVCLEIFIIRCPGEAYSACPGAWV